MSRRRAGYAMILVICLLAILTGMVFSGTKRLWLLDRQLDHAWQQITARHDQW